MTRSQSIYDFLKAIPFDTFQYFDSIYYFYINSYITTASNLFLIFI